MHSITKLTRIHCGNFLTGGQGHETHEYRISIQNPPETPWLDWIQRGTKTYEGRLNRGLFKKISIGDILIFYNKNDYSREVRTIVTDLKYYDNFGAAFADLGSALVPLADIDEAQVNKFYLQYFSPDDIKQHGVIAIGIKVV